VASIQDVANAAGVGVSTVSKVLNGYRDVAIETRDRVLNAVEKLSYQPNRAARSFRTGKTQTISVFVPQIGTDFYDRLITSIDSELAAHEYDAALFPLLNEHRLARYRSSEALPYQTDGVIFASLNPDWLFQDAAVPGGLPTVLVDAYHARYDTISVDNAGGAYVAAEHLLRHDLPTFIMLAEGYDETPFSSGVFLERLKGFQRAVEDHDPSPVGEPVVLSEFAAGPARTTARELLQAQSGPFCVFASCDLFARAVLDEANALERVVGQEVFVVGFDDQPWAKSMGLSTVRQPVDEMGAMATEFVLGRLAEPNAPVKHHEIEPELVVRESS
jgi:LacI family transcriptional regulator